MFEQAFVKKNGDINRRLGSRSSKLRDRHMIRYIAIIVGLLAFINTINTKRYYFSSSSIGYVQSQFSLFNNGETYQTIGRYTNYEITTTNYNWLSEVGEQIPRSKVMEDFFNSVLNHPRYDKTLWSTLDSNSDPNRPILAFLDAETCSTVHWPSFGSNKHDSWDIENGRPSYKEANGREYVSINGKAMNMCSLIDMALESPAIKANKHSRLFIPNCLSGEGPAGTNCLGPARNATKYKQLVVGHLAKQFSEINPQDFGLAGWPVKTIENFQRDNVCNNNLPYLIAFKGRRRNHFFEFSTYFEELAKTRDDVYINFGTDHYKDGPIKISQDTVNLTQTPKELQSNETYYQLMTQSTFCPVPRGDNLFSVRFGEILSGGCIPIIYANGWVLPYTTAVVDWYKLAVIIPQQNVHHTLDYIEHMSEEEICERRLMAYDFFHTYVKTGKERLNAIVKVMDERLRTGRLFQFQAVPGIASHPDSIAMYQYKGDSKKQIRHTRYKNSLPTFIEEED